MRLRMFRDIVCGRTEHYENIFESETLHYPGFVEFDEVNSIILTYSAGGKPGYFLPFIAFFNRLTNWQWLLHGLEHGVVHSSI